MKRGYTQVLPTNTMRQRTPGSQGKGQSSRYWKKPTAVHSFDEQATTYDERLCPLWCH